jgi:ketosteroid isomerase-like protein
MTLFLIREMHNKETIMSGKALSWMSQPSEFEQLVRLYYLLVDGGRIDDLLTLFSDDIYYERCRKEINGIAELSHFYRTVRQLEGSHLIRRILGSQRNLIAIEGSFIGYRDGQPINIKFVDVFLFDENSKVCQRHTYTDQGNI